jgi:hypothetical protein
MPESTGISVTPEKLQEKYNEIKELDEQLDAASGSESAGKRALGNQLASEYETQWKKSADNLVNTLQKIEDPSQKAGVFTGILNHVNSILKEEIDNFLAAEVATRQSEMVPVSAEDLQALTDSRKTNVEQYRALRQILEMFGQDVSTIPEPKKRTGARGKRGPRVLTGFDFAIDGAVRSSSQNNLSSIANTVTSDLNWKTIDLRNFLEEKLAETGHSLQNPPVEGFEFTLPNGKVLTATPGEEAPEDEDDEAEATEDENGDEETE